jgi:DNA-binding MarR family transcriptional regulator
MDPGALSRQLSSLDSLGWISRAADSNDRRITNVHLTKKGEHEVEKSLPKRASFIERTLGDIPEKQLSQMMKTLLLLETRFSSGSRAQEPKEDAQTS